jgi:hypothetical protein
MTSDLSKKRVVIKTSTHAAVLAMLSFLVMVAACARTPNIYVMNPVPLETVRSGISTVGVSLSPKLPETKVLLPAKGVWGGIKRGIVFGAALPVMLGFASPVPGGTYLGLLVSPFSAVAGGVYGVSAAVPAQEVEQAETMLTIAADNLRQMGLREQFVNRVIDLGNARTPIQFIPYPDASFAPPHHGTTELRDPKSDSIDAQLLISVEVTGLRGIYSINPPMDTFLRIHAQLIRSADRSTLLDEHFICASDEERTFADWADHEGIDLVDEFKSCVPELAEKIIDDFFLVYPVEWNDGQSD